MARFIRKLRERKRLKMSAMGKASQRVQAAKRMVEITPEFLAELASAMPLGPGDEIWWWGDFDWMNAKEQAPT